MRRLELALCVALVVTASAGCSSDDSNNGNGADASGVDTAVAHDAPAPDTATPDAGSAADTASNDDGGTATTDGSDVDGAAGDGGQLSVEAMRGKYLVGVLGCPGCHTPKVPNTTMADATMLLGGVDCFVSTPGCLSSANLTPDMETGIGGFSDQAVIDAFRLGKDPDPAAAGKFIFARMPYYQFANLNDADAHAIVAYLRALPPVKHMVKEPTAPFDQAPTAAEWTAVDPSKLPAPGASAPADAANGKYFATIMCVTCHSAAPTNMPKHVDETIAFQGGQAASLMSNGMTVMFQSANLTPDATGIKDWSVTDVATAIVTAKDKMGKSLCAPMRANAAISAADATAIADYLLSIPPVAHAVTACGARM